jgi:hypothetical protein
MTNGSPTPQLTQLMAEWPEATNAYIHAWGRDPGWDTTDAENHNDAGYLLWGLRRFESRARETQPTGYPSHTTLDQAAAREIAWQYTRNPPWRRPVAALASCLYNLVTERPHRLCPRKERFAWAGGNETKPTSERSQKSATATPSKCSGPGGPEPIAAVLASAWPL